MVVLLFVSNLAKTIVMLYVVMTVEHHVLIDVLQDVEIDVTMEQLVELVVLQQIVHHLVVIIALELVKILHVKHLVSNHVKLMLV